MNYNQEARAPIIVRCGSEGPKDAPKGKSSYAPNLDLRARRGPDKNQAFKGTNRKVFFSTVPKLLIPIKVLISS